MRLGLAGLGVASTMFLTGADEHPHTKIVAAADLRPSSLQAFQQRFGGRVYESIEALCTDRDIDVVWVSTPNHLHAEHCILAANHGKHVICTKPMALTIGEAIAMCEAAEKNGVRLLCGQTFSMYPDIQLMCDVIRSGVIGKLISVQTWLSTDWLLKPRVAEELDEARGGGVVYRHGPHLVDTVRLLGDGHVRSVRAGVGRWMAGRPCAGNFSAFLEFADGTPATISYSGYGYFDTSELSWGIGTRMYSDEERVTVRRRLRAGGVDGEAAKEGMRFGAAASDPSSRGSAETRRAASGDFGRFGITVASCERGDIRQSREGLYVYDDDGRREIPGSKGRMGTLEMHELHAALTEAKPLLHDGRWGLATLEVCLAIVESAKQRREIALHHQVGSSGGAK